MRGETLHKAIFGDSMEMEVLDVIWLNRDYKVGFTFERLLVAIIPGYKENE